MTSSLNSRPLADCQGALLAAVSDVAENSLFTFADASDAAAFDAAFASSVDGGWLCARIRFAGSTSGEFIMTVPVALARRLCAAFAGADTTDVIGEDDLVDFTGELANMVCGAWLTRTCQHEAFDLTPPRVLRDGPGRAMSGDPGDVDSVYLAIDDTPIRLEIAWGATVPTAPHSGSERPDAR